MVDYLKSVIRELMPAWLMRKSVDVDVRKVEQPPLRDLIGAAPPVQYRGPVRSESENRQALPQSYLLRIMRLEP